AGYLIMNTKESKEYFHNRNFKADNQSDLVVPKKAESTFRMFVPRSATVGRLRYYSAGSCPRSCTDRLSKTCRASNVVGGTTAINSYTLLDLTDKIIEQQPDVVIIYAGHNEYYGALGVGSYNSFETHPYLVRSYLFFKNFRFFQLLDNTYSKVFRNKTETPG